RRLPWRPHPQSANADGPVEAAPAVFPARLDIGTFAGAEEVPQALLARGVGVRGELDAARPFDLLEALGEELDHGRARVLGTVVPDLNGDAPETAQRNALFSFSKKLSSWRYVSASLAASNSCSSFRCSSLSRRGTETLTSTRWSPRPNPCSTGIPLPRSTRTSPGCVPAASSSSSGPSSVSIVSVAPRAACTIVRSTWE